MANLKDTSDISNWKPESKHVDDKVREGVVTQSSNILIAVGPHRLAKLKGFAVGTDGIISNAGFENNTVFPLGTVGSIQVNTSRPTPGVREIGSKLQYFIPANVSGNISMSKMYLDGPSLMKALYSFMSASEIATANSDLRNLPGKGDLWLNVGAKIFDKPIGIMLWFKNNEGENIGATYYENCMAQGHSFGLQAGGGIFGENTTFVFDKSVPIRVNTEAEEFAKEIKDGLSLL